MKNERHGVNTMAVGKDTIACPVCNESLFKSELGIRSHLNKHVREKKITPDERIEHLQKLLNYRIKGSRS